MTGFRLPGILRLLPSPAYVPDPQRPVTLAQLPEGSRILDVGSGGRRLRPDVTTCDFLAGPGVDVVGDIHSLPIPSDTYDGVFCTGTLEHVEDPRLALSELVRVARPGGLLHIDVPFIQGYHPDPVDYWRFTLEGLRLLCRKAGLEDAGSGVHIGPSCGLYWVAREWANSVSSSRVLSNLLLIPTALLLWPLKFLDHFARGPRAHHVASAVYFRGRKPG
jgi:SAM-dependent methyltransferase